MKISLVISICNALAFFSLLLVDFYFEKKQLKELNNKVKKISSKLIAIKGSEE